jgi:galacturan 1,4-alpha-galacturonidase
MAFRWPHRALDPRSFVIMRTQSFRALVAAIALASPALTALTCKVKALGGGQDDGPNILAAFERCGKNGRITLDEYYVVDTLLLTTGLENVEIDLSGTGA